MKVVNGTLRDKSTDDHIGIPGNKNSIKIMSLVVVSILNSPGEDYSIFYYIQSNEIQENIY